jgi:HEPN domain-containing protein
LFYTISVACFLRLKVERTSYTLLTDLYYWLKGLGKELPKEWTEKARVFLEEAERHVRVGYYWLACFEAQQAAELYLKALLVALTGTHPYTHDLVELLKTFEELGIEVSEELKVYGDALTPHYTLARYPGRKPLSYDEERARRCVNQARAFKDWVEKNADP